MTIGTGYRTPPTSALLLLYTRMYVCVCVYTCMCVSIFVTLFTYTLENSSFLGSISSFFFLLVFLCVFVAQFYVWSVYVLTGNKNIFKSLQKKHEKKSVYLSVYMYLSDLSILNKFTQNASFLASITRYNKICTSFSRKHFSPYSSHFILSISCVYVRTYTHI